jgi:tRNA nucleotidyltransferase/poly(A) polymerase
MISILDEIANRLPPFSAPAYLVGGCVRDALLGRPPADIDVAVAEPPEAAARRTAAAAKGRLVIMGTPPDAVYRIVTADRILDVAGLAGGAIGADLGRRDFTINAMAYDIAARRLLDPAGGRADLDGRRIRPVNGRVFAEDPVRLIRALRFGAELDFELTAEAWAGLRENAPRLAAPPGERLRGELHKLLDTGRAAPFLAIMGETGLMTALLPNPPAPDPAPCGRLDQWFGAPEALPPEAAGAIRRLPPDRRRPLRYGALLDVPGMTPAPALNRLAALAGRLRWSRRETDRVHRLLRHRPMAARLFGATEDLPLASGAAARLFRACGAEFSAVVLLALAGDPPRAAGRAARAEALLAHHRRVIAPRLGEPPLLTGRDLAGELGLSPSPRFAELLEDVELARLAGTIRTRGQALERVRRRLDGGAGESGR